MPVHMDIYTCIGYYQYSKTMFVKIDNKSGYNLSITHMINNLLSNWYSVPLFS